VVGNVPEAIWTECCANLNELSLTFNDVSVDCWKISGYYALCIANYEDSDIDLANEILTALGQAIGLGIDKAILYGGNTYTEGTGTTAVTYTNTNMPLGIVTRLTQTTAPAGYSTTERAWEDLHTSNVTTINTANSTGIKLFQGIVGAFSNVSSKYARNDMVWVMNRKTYTALQVEAMSVNASGAIVSGMGNTMPILGGAIEVLDFMPDNVIVCGYFEDYLLAERAGQKFASSEHVRFLNDQIVFKATARYDGKAVIAEAFAAIGIKNASVDAGAVHFAQDTANA
jgi:HK97 family phage major capsid protein